MGTQITITSASAMTAKSVVAVSFPVALSPANPTLLLDYGQLLIQQNRQEDGLQHVRVALRYSEQFGVEFLRRDEAERLIRQHGAAEDAAAASET